MHALCKALHMYPSARNDAYLRIDYLAELILIDHAFPLDRAYIGYKFSDHHIAGSHSTHNFIVGMGFFLTQDLTRYVCRAQDVLLDGFPVLTLSHSILGERFCTPHRRCCTRPSGRRLEQASTALASHMLILCLICETRGGLNLPMPCQLRMLACGLL